MDKNTNDFGFESYEEEPQQMSTDQPMMEDYDPMDEDLPYIPSMGQPKQQQSAKPPQFVDLSNPQAITSRNDAGQQPNTKFQQQLEAEQSMKPQAFNVSEFSKQADKTKKSFSDVMNMTNQIAKNTDEYGEDVRGHATGVALKAFHDAIKMLKEIDYWIPPGKEEYAPALKKIAEPIISALGAYLKKVKTLK